MVCGWGEQTAESYTEGLRQRYTLMMGVSAVYIAGYVLVFVVLRKKENKNENSSL